MESYCRSASFGEGNDPGETTRASSTGYNRTAATSSAGLELFTFSHLTTKWSCISLPTYYKDMKETNLCELGLLCREAHDNLQLRILPLLQSAKSWAHQQLLCWVFFPYICTHTHRYLHYIYIKIQARKVNKQFTVNLTSFPSKAGKMYFDCFFLSARKS